MYAGADYWKYANETILTIAMIETQEALDNLDVILKVPGLDSIYVGPSDLGLSLGFPPGPDPTTPKVMEAIKFIVDTAKKHKIPAGIHCGQPVWAREMIGLGYQLVTLGNDNTLMQSARAPRSAPHVKAPQRRPRRPGCIQGPRPEEPAVALDRRSPPSGEGGWRRWGSRRARAPVCAILRDTQGFALRSSG